MTEEALMAEIHRLAVKSRDAVLLAQWFYDIHSGRQANVTPSAQIWIQAQMDDLIADW